MEYIKLTETYDYLIDSNADLIKGDYVVIKRPLHPDIVGVYDHSFEDVLFIYDYRMINYIGFIMSDKKYVFKIIKTNNPNIPTLYKA